MARPPTQRLRAFTEQLKRVHIILVLGFAIPAVGALISAPVMDRLLEAWGGEPRGPFEAVVLAVLSQLGCLAIMPLVAYAAARFLPLAAGFTALGLSLVGQGVVLELSGLVGDSGRALSTLDVGVRFLCAVLGGLLTFFAVQRARKSAEKTSEVTRAERAARDAEYGRFLEEAARIGELRRKVPHSPPPDDPRL